MSGRLSLSRRRFYTVLSLATVLALLLSLFPFNLALPGPLPDLGPQKVSAHNLQTRAISMFMDPATQAVLDARMAAPGWVPPDPLLQAGDELGLIIKVVPRDGTTTGVGGHIDFYVPNGVTVLDTAYIVPDGSGGFVKVAMKGQSPIAIGDGPIGAKTTTEMAGIPSVGSNIVGVTELPATASGLHRGTIAGVYGDTGVFYATDPDAAYGSWQKFTGDWNNANPYANKCGSLAFTAANGKTITNNSGDTVVPCNKWDAEQLFAWGAKGTTYGTAGWPDIPIVDYGDGRGNAPWGFAAGTGGPQSGYAWNFDWDEWLASAKDKPAVQAAMANDEVGPWKRIKYSGSRIAKDQPGLESTTLGYASVDGSSVGFALSPATPLPDTVSQTDATSPKAIRWAVGQLTAYRPEYAWVKIKVNSVAEIVDPTGCPVFHSDTFGGDAGGTDNGKDHLWRYYEPTEATWNGCLAAQKPATREIVKVGETYQYKLKVYNFQNFTLTNVVVRDILPGGVTFLSAVPAQNSGPNPLVWNVGTLLPGQKWEATVSVTAKSTGFLDNCMEISSGQLPPQTVCDSTTSGGYPYLVPTKTTPTSTIAPGGTVTYTLVVKNVGTASSASPVVLEEYLPPGFTYQALVGQVKVNGASVPQTTVNASNPNQPIFTVPAAIQAGKDLQLSFTAKAPANITPGTYCNVYRVVDNGIPITSGSEACVTVGGGNGKIGDTIFRDWNGNGAQDAGEEGLPGVTVTLTRPDSSTVTTVTDANGQYLFASLAPGSYTVSVPAAGSGGVPAGYVLTADPDGSPYSLSYVKNLATDEVYLGADFGYKPTGSGSIGDQVFDDKNLSGVFDAGDVGIPNITVRLYEDSNGNGVIDAGDALVATTASIAGGTYGFTGLATGFKYIVDVDQTDADLATYFGGGVFTQTTADPHNVGTLAGAYTAADFGFHKDVPPGTFSIGDMVFFDANNNGVYDSGDTPLPNVGLTLYQDTNNNNALDGGDVAIGTTTSSITGLYAFSNLPAGEYLVDVNQADPDIPSGYTLSSLATDPFPVTLGPSTTSVDFPFVAVPPPPSPLTKAVDKATANPGDVLTYSLTTHYTGNSLLSNVVVTDTVPAGTKYVADSDTPEATVTPADNNTASLLTWNLGSNAAGVPGNTTGGPATTFSALQDASVTSARPDNNFGGQTQLGVNSVYHSLIQFDLSSIPAGTPIAYAELVLNRTGGTITPSGSIEVRALTQSWQEGTQNDDACTDGVTWNNRDCSPVAAWTTVGGTINGTVYATRAVVTGVNTWDVTSLAQAWVDGSLANNGLLLQMASGADSHNFSSKEGATPPQLKIYAGPKTGMALWAPASATPSYSLWDGSIFGTATSTGVTTGSALRIMQGAAAPTRNEKIVVGIINNASNNVVAAQWNGSAWSAASINPLGTVAETFWWTADVAYEQNSGDAVMVWGDGATLEYSVWNGASWIAVGNPTVGNTPKQIKLASKPGSDEIIMVVSSTAGDYVMVWNGSSWGSFTWLYNVAQTDFTDVYVAYEQGTGRAMVVYGKNSDANVYYRFWNGSTWSSEATLTPPSGVTSRVKWLRLASDPTSNRIALGVQTDTGPVGWLNVWSGSAWGTSFEATTALSDGVSYDLGVAFEGASGEALAVYGKSAQTSLFYRTWTSSGGWSAEATGPALTSAPNTLTLDSQPFGNRIMLLAQDSSNDLRGVLWNGNSFGTAATLSTNTGEVKNQPFVYMWDRAASTSLSSVKDTQLAALSPTFNYGASQTIDSYNVTTNIRKALFKFDVSSIPAGATILSASMDLYTYFIATANTPVRAHRLTADWDEGTQNAAAGISNWTQRLAAGPTSWTTAGGDYDPVASASITTNGTTAGTYHFNLTSLVQDWADGVYANHGVILLNDAGFSGVSWRPKEWGTATQQPKLSVVYEVGSNTSLGNVMAASPTLVTAGSTITVTMALTSSTSIANVSPNTLVITGTNGVNATLLTGPTPASATIGASPTTFTWTYQATGSNIGTVTFGGDADDGGSNTWPWAQSNSVIVHPPLTFQVTVDNPATVNPVLNTGYIKDASGAIPPSPSNTVQTVIGASIGDFVWADLDGGGDQDVGEPGISGVQVCATPVGGGATACATTDSQGAYHIYGLTNGVQYTVSMTPATIPANYLPTTPTTLTRTASVATPVTDADFGLRPPGQASIGDTVWIDADEDGVLDAGESGLPGITVKLYDSTGANLLKTTTTDANGVYTFTGLYAGAYKVQVDTSSAVTSPYDGATTLAAAMDLVSVAGSTIPPLNNPLTVNVPTNTSQVLTADFGFNWGGSIGDYVWWDNNINRLQDESPVTPIANAAVLLYFDANNNGKLDALGGDTQIGFALTNASGLYLFDNLPPGAYLVDVYEDSITTDGDRDIVPTTANVVYRNLAPKEDYLAADFGYYEGAKVEGNVFWDEDHNGVLDGAEQNPTHLLNNVTVHITCLGPDGVVGGGDDYTGSVDSGTSGLPDGHFAFVVPPGPCTLTYDQLDIPAVYGDRTTPISFTFTAVGGDDWHPSFDFGVDNTGTIGDVVWNDGNADGVQNPTESGIAGVTVSLYNDAGTTLLGVTVTDSFGGYLFSGLPDGNYRVVVSPSTLPTPPAGLIWIQSGDPDVSPPACAGPACDNRGDGTVSGGGSDLTVDFGYRLVNGVGGSAGDNTITGLVWEDIDGDGVPDYGNPLAGVVVTVDCGDAGVFFTTTSGSVFLGSNWAVSGIPNGASCTVTVDTGTLPSPAYTQTGDPDVASPPACSGATCDNKTVVNIPLVGGDVTDVNFGYMQRLGSITGTVCSGNLSGDCVGGEPVLGGVAITLRFAGDDGILGTGDDVVSPQQTDANGNYSFANLEPGLYQIVETNLANYSSLSDADSPNSFGNPDNITIVLDYGPDGIPGNADDRMNRINQDFEDAPPVDLVLTKSDRFDPAVPGSTIVYSIAITNTGPGVANNVIVTDTLPANVTFASATPGYTGPNPVVWNAGTLGVNATRSFTIAVTANLGFTGVITNTATTRTTSTEPNLANNTDQEPTTIAAPASIGDFVYLDSNGDGVQGPGETLGIAGVPVTVRNIATNVQTTIQTGPTGLYQVGNLPPGTYEVSAPASWPGLTRTSPSPLTVNLSAGQNYALADFGYIAPTSVELASFTATDTEAGVVVRWKTFGEEGITGFLVWRASAANGAYEAVSDVIPSQSASGSSYDWLDASAGPGSWYKLQSQPNGRFFGPIPTTPEGGLKPFFLPRILLRR